MKANDLLPCFQMYSMDCIQCTGQKWFRRRKLLTPSFHFKILEEFLHVFNSQSQIFIDILKEDSDDGQEVLEICQYVTRCTLDTICGRFSFSTSQVHLLLKAKCKTSSYLRGEVSQFFLMLQR